jgi:predicted amidohydrolase
MTVKLSLIQMNSAQERDANVAKAGQLIDQAAKENPDLVVLPEFFNALYFGQYRDYKYVAWAERDDGYTMAHIREKARKHGIHIIATIYEEEMPGICYDTAMVVDPQGEIVGKYRKTHPAAYRSLESIYYRYGSKFPVFQIGDWKVGMVICYDLFFPEPARCVTLNGAELVVVPFAEPAGFLTPETSNIPTDTGEARINMGAWYDMWQARMRVRALQSYWTGGGSALRGRYSGGRPQGKNCGRGRGQGRSYIRRAGPGASGAGTADYSLFKGPPSAPV